ncbi:DMT family transporter [bacterium]|nr:DMT family transporter [bacterium]
MDRSERTTLYVILIIAMSVWGLSWTNGKILGQYTSIPILMTLRFFIAAISMLIVLLIRNTPIKIEIRGALPIIYSAILLVLYNHFYFTGTRLGSAGAGGVLVTTLNPVLTFVLISFVQKSIPHGRPLVGIILGILGGTILINIWQEGLTAIFSSGNQYFVLCAISWAFLTLISAGINKHMSTLTYSFWLYLLSSLISVVLVRDQDLFVVFSFDFKFWLNLLLVSVGAMAFATTAYFIAATKLGSEKASAFIFTVPVSAMLFSMLILDEPLKLNVLIGGAVSIIAVYLINSNKKDYQKSE